MTQVISSALMHNPELQRRRAKAEITQAEARAFSAVQNPFLTTEFDPMEKVYRFGIQKALETGGAPKWAEMASRKRAEIEQAELERDILDLKSNITRAYTEAYINQERIELYKEIYDFIKSKYKEYDNISVVDKLLIEEELINLEQQSEDARQEIEKAHLVMERLTGRNVIEGRKLQNPRVTRIKENLTLEMLVLTALIKRPEVLTIQKELELAEILRRLAIANFYPLIIVEVGGGFNVDAVEERPGSVFASVDIELPILGIEKRQLKAATIRVQQVLKQKKTIEENIKHDVTHTFSLYKYSKERIEKYEKVHLPRLIELMEEVRERYENGEIPIRELLTAEKSRLAIRNDYFDALSDYEYAVSELERAVGTSLEEEDGVFPPYSGGDTPPHAIPYGQQYERLPERLPEKPRRPAVYQPIAPFKF